METEDFTNLFLSNTDIAFYPIDISTIVSLLIMVLLLFCSALISGSEVAFFSLSPQNINELESEENQKNRRLLKLLRKPEQLLATILIANNFVNIGIVILSSFITNSLVDFSNAPTLGFVVQVVVITFLLLLFGEIIPKVYATQTSVRFSKFMAFPLFYLEKLFRPLSIILIKSTSIVNKSISKKQNISMVDLSQALELTADEISEEMEILEGIVNFGNINVEEIMISRVDAIAVDLKTNFSKVKSVIIESGFSRIPVFDDSFDNVKGILYVKDLLPHHHKANTFRWQSIIRPPYYVPETKKINDLLEEFQTQKNHMAIVVDEYGGTSGIITMEDILEEIVGDITDESDDEKATYTLEKDGSYLFEGKTLLNDFFKIVDTEADIFESIKGDADTLAGLLLEIKGEIPQKKEMFKYQNHQFIVEAVDNRRIKKIRFIPPKVNSKN
ncbi:gliding motility-associated protein GldE [Labilibaculum sp. DW002]|uniref:Gliding motility-associated protein GldE n=1 Tax=Paralabilibaculum antarcticum TaxID=2912572 RepID=A0ABT5VRQ6_9BACT|nr:MULTISPECIES: gliding motility-associated protein GldE [unclassified Labilibaculum]MDE5418119.1 gliding motility-associated protein GldE [Labilibaculum sp. DW002]